ncbi:cupin domain-containing protein [Streptomyces sp. NPDC006984]|uniref:JmjC domain-containing protein n=1 Tax=Streptomyces sp. NPDC006984 TaxID=3155463 RepID=UPI0033D20C43
MGSEDLFAAWGLPSDFVARHWRRTYAVGRGGPEAVAPGALPPTVLDRLLRQGLRADRVSVSTEGRLHHPAEFTQVRTLADRPVADLVDGERIHRLLDAGATVVLANAEHWVPEATDLSSRLSEDFGCEVQAHVFCTAADHSGLVPHVDGEENFLLQLAGSKTWSLWEREGTSASQVDPSRLGRPAAEVILKPGDVLYIPLGWVHAATAGDEGSTHITYQVVPASLVDVVLEQLGDLLDDLLGDRLSSEPRPIDATAAAGIAERIAAAVRHDSYRADPSA